MSIPRTIVFTLSILLLVQAVSGLTIPVTQTPALYVSDYGDGVTHQINSYTLQPTGAIPNGAWMVLGTNDQMTFARIDARKDISFSGRETKQFNVANSGSYRWYYLYLQDGFSVGSSLEFNLTEQTPPPVPDTPESTGVSIAIERTPLIIIFDFNGAPTKVDHYTFTTSDPLAGVQSWQLRGTNDPGMLGSDNPGAFTVLDDQSGIGFESGVPQQFNVTSPSDFLYYVIYLQDGFYVKGLNLDVHLYETPPTPTPTPTVTPTPTPPVLPVVDFTGSPRAGFVPLEVNFTDQSVGTFSNWSWDFGDGNTSPERNPVHTYVTGGLFSVNLTVCNDGGCTWLNRSSYVYTIPPDSATPTGTPAYYIRIGGGSTGISSTGSSSTGSSTTGSSLGTNGAAQSGVGEALGTGSTGTSTGSSSVESNGARGSQGSQGTGVTGQVQPGTAGAISVLMDTLQNLVTVSENLLEYLQSQLRILLGR